MNAPLLEVEHLTTTFATRAGRAVAVDDVSFQIARGECLGVVGESGSGKSVTFLSVLGLIRPPGETAARRLAFDGRELSTLSPAERRDLRGRDIAVTMQDALTALNPALTVSTQIVETLRAHGRAANAREARARAVSLMERVGIPAARARLDDYPHQFSGGMRQRIMIAIALACAPRLLIADEPTTALDVTIQAQVLDLIADLRRDGGLAVALITHDLGVVAEQADRVIVMYAGEIVEEGPTAEVIETPLHPYTAGLLASMPRLDALDRPRKPIPGHAPGPAELPAHCRFMARCAFADARCAAPVALADCGGGRKARCVRPGAAS